MKSDLLHLHFTRVSDGILIEGLRAGRVRVSNEIMPAFLILSDEGSLYPFRITHSDIDPHSMIWTVHLGDWFSIAGVQ